MHVASIISTKGGEGKTTTTANLGGFAADAGLRVCLIDLDNTQPTLSSYYPLAKRAPEGIYELLAFNQRNLSQLISRTTVKNLDLVLSNDPNGQLNTLLLHAPDGRLRLRNLLPVFAPHYDLMLIDTQGARSVLLEMAFLASDLVVSPVIPEILAAREMQRGTLQLIEDVQAYRHLGIPTPPLRLMLNRVRSVSKNSSLIRKTMHEVFNIDERVKFLKTGVPAIEAYPKAATECLPVHRIETRRPKRRKAPAAIETVRSLACELFPQWHGRFSVFAYWETLGKVSR